MLPGDDTCDSLFYLTLPSFSSMTQKLYWEFVFLGFCGRISFFKLSLS